MKNMKKLLLLSLIAVSLLTACGKDEEKKNDSNAATQTAQTTTDKTDAANTQANDALASQAPVTAEHTIDYATAATQEAIDETCEYFLKQQPDADPEATKSELAQLANYVLAANSLNLDRTESLKEVVTAMGGDAQIKTMIDNGIPQSYIDLILAYQASSIAITDYMKANNLLVDGKEQFMNTYWRAKHVLISTEGKTDAEKAEAKTLAADILARAQAGENFDELVAEYSEDPGSKSQPDGYVFTTGTMVKEFEEGTKNTPVGQFTLVETSFGFHVIQRLALDETPELYEKFYAESGIEATLNEKTIIDFVNQHA